MRVTELIRACGLMDLTWCTQEALDRGTAVHLACELDDRGDLDESSVDPVIMPYLMGWRKFKREMEPQILSIEEEVEHPAYKGRLDRRLILNAREGIGDIKSGPPADWIALQLAGYAMCFDRPLARWAIHLSADGKYKLIEHSDRKDFDVWKACVTLANWKARTS